MLYTEKSVLRYYVRFSQIRSHIDSLCTIVIKFSRVAFDGQQYYIIISLFTEVIRLVYLALEKVLPGFQYHNTELGSILNADIKHFYFHMNSV